MFSKKIFTLILIVTILSLLILSVSCTQPVTEQDAGSIKVTDGIGQQVSMDRPVEKMIVFAPSVLEVLDALDAMDKVIGVDSWSIESGEPLAQGFEAYGDFNGPNIEKIAEANPDLVIRLSGSSEEDYDKLRELGITIYTFEAQSFDWAYQEIINLGQMIGKEDEAEQLKNEFEQQVEDIYTKVKDLEQDQKPTVFYEIFDDPLWSAGKDTYINDMIEKAGGINIVARDGLEGYAEYSVEKLLDNNPQVMVAGDGGMYEARTGEIILEDPRFSTVSAVTGGRVYVVPENSIVRPNHNSVKGLMMLAKAFHQDIFGQFEIIE
ncbi:MAG: ABC transporter substrate-binding protein [Actinomycetia bacterium]|nr:ABC transporter substrate-binding protein [Actinomycetes bacterium]